MKENILLGLVVLITSFAAMAMQWSKVEDTCGKCKINDLERKCGKCGGFMESDQGEIVKGDWLKSTYTCKKCDHSCIYKCK
ncbi:MAG: hypothetical protein J6C59_04575 [Muribaculaceae bacterium]|nr:hypothetical protein [Muribaculaceae bacterium]